MPPFLPLVLYNGERPWAAAADAGERIAPGPEGLEAYAPRLRHALIDEGRLPDAALEQPENLMAALAAVERSAAPLEVAAVVARLVRWLRRPQDRTLRRASVGWLTRVLLPSRLGGVAIPEARNLEELRTMLEERVLQWTEEWKQQGLQEGRRVGLREGLKQSEELLLRQLQLKFGPLDDEVRARVAAADGDERLLSARTLDEVFD